MLRYFFFIALIVILSSCSDIPSANLNFTLSDTVSNWTAGKAVLDATFYAAQDASVVSGGIAVDGSFSATLSSSLDPALLEPLVRCEGLQVSSAALKINQFSAFTVSQASKDLGLLAQVSSEAVLTNGLVKLGDYYVVYLYANTAATVQGDCPLSGVPGIFRYDLNLKKGWNVAVFSLIAEAKGVQTLELASKVVPAGAVWLFY